MPDAIALPELLIGLSVGSVITAAILSALWVRGKSVARIVDDINAELSSGQDKPMAVARSDETG